MKIDLYSEAGKPHYWPVAADVAWRAHGGSSEEVVSLVEKDGDEVAVGVTYPIFNVYGLSEDIQEAVRLAGKGGTIRLDLNSPGGSVFDAVEAISRLRRFEGTVKVHVLGLAASAAQYLSMAASPGQLAIGEDAQMMIHRVSAGLVQIGTSEDILRGASSLAKAMRNAEGSIARAIAARMRLPQKRVRALMEEETYFSAQEAVKARLADSVIRGVDSGDADDAESGASESSPGNRARAISNAARQGCDVEAVAAALERRLA